MTDQTDAAEALRAHLLGAHVGLRGEHPRTAEAMQEAVDVVRQNLASSPDGEIGHTEWTQSDVLAMRHAQEQAIVEAQDRTRIIDQLEAAMGGAPKRDLAAEGAAEAQIVRQAILGRAANER